MPWDAGQQKFIRENGRFTGPQVWDDDATALQNIDSLGHDTHDQDIADGITECLNVNGITTMLADLNMGSFKIVGMADGTGTNDGVNFGQLTVVDGKTTANAADISTLGGRVTQNEADIAANTAAIGALPTEGTVITAQSFDGANFTSTRTEGDFTTPLKTFNEIVVASFKSDGPIKHVVDDQGTGAASINVAAFNRHRVNNTGALTITFTGVPSGNDTDLGAAWQAEGQVIVWNGPSPGAITIAGVTARVLGEPNTTSNGVCVLTYLMQWVNGGLETTLIWSA